MIQGIKADTLGIVSGSLCLLHCVATPFLFLVKACTTSCCASSELPVWWHLIDYFFIIVSFIAIYYATRNTTKNWVRTALWISWGILLLILLNEAFQWLSIPERMIYLPAASIISLHFYNKKYCKCVGTKCYTN